MICCVTRDAFPSAGIIRVAVGWVAVDKLIRTPWKPVRASFLAFGHRLWALAEAALSHTCIPPDSQSLWTLVQVAWLTVIAQRFPFFRLCPLPKTYLAFEDVPVCGSKRRAVWQGSWGVHQHSPALRLSRPAGRIGAARGPSTSSLLFLPMAGCPAVGSALVGVPAASPARGQAEGRLRRAGELRHGEPTSAGVGKLR